MFGNKTPWCRIYFKRLNVIKVIKKCSFIERETSSAASKFSQLETIPRQLDPIRTKTIHFSNINFHMIIQSTTRSTKLFHNKPIWENLIFKEMGVPKLLKKIFASLYELAQTYSHFIAIFWTVLLCYYNPFPLYRG
jgi:hypothetical protein